MSALQWCNFCRRVTRHAVLQGTMIAIDILSGYCVSEMSLDHDLGGDDTTRSVVRWLCENPDFWPGTIHVHTANPVGREWLEGMVNRYGPGVS